MIGYELIDPKISLDRYHYSDFADLYGYVYPDIAYADLKLLVDFEMFMFLYDDQFSGDKGATLDGPLESMHEVLTVMHSMRTPEPATPFGPAFYDILNRMSEGMSPVWCRHFRWDMQRFFASYVHEAENRARRDDPLPIDLYLKQRQWALGVEPSIDAIERGGHFEIPATMRSDPYILGMREDVNYFIALTNDVDSVHKERLLRDVNNIVLLLERRGFGTAEAMDRAAVMAEETLVRFCRRATLLSDSPGYRSLTHSERISVDRYLIGLQNWIAGYYEWTGKTGRYARRNAEAESAEWAGPE
ncbi:terpene synthase family protein [Nocardia arthritidis]|uniref:Uncharacterized protein n=1 Tax=Nocardia arthritidis TaxID=228602 RepID=A0A6G9YFQ7_9NOCA|nr:hypothetical protein [Nocardia arthritidis]QIS11876.1 hypothetical protein F5544_20040 [Nocardia arthritidis]